MAFFYIFFLWSYFTEKNKHFCQFYHEIFFSDPWWATKKKIINILPVIHIYFWVENSVVILEDLTFSGAVICPCVVPLSTSSHPFYIFLFLCKNGCFSLTLVFKLNVKQRGFIEIIVFSNSLEGEQQYFLRNNCFCLSIEWENAIFLRK